MSTRSRIGVAQDDGAIQHVYCHLNGKPEDNGQTLVDHYTTQNQAQELVDLGNLATLGPTLEWTPPARGLMAGPSTFACHRDRGDSWNRVGTVTSTLEEYQQGRHRGWVEYIYLFQNGEWQVMRSTGPDRWFPVREPAAV